MWSLLDALRALWRRLRRRPSPPPIPARQAAYVSRRGQALASHGEVMIANWLDRHGYAWEYEARVAGFTPDFLLREERVIIEYWGMIGANPRYDARIREKKKRYEREGYRVLGIKPKNLRALDAKLEKVLGKKK